MAVTIEVTVDCQNRRCQWLYVNHTIEGARVDKILGIGKLSPHIALEDGGLKDMSRWLEEAIP